MREHTVELEPLPGQSSFVIGRYGLEPVRLEGILKLNWAKVGRSRPNDTKPQIQLSTANLLYKPVERTPQVTLFKGATVSFTGTVTAALPSCNDFQFVNLESSISAEDCIKLDTNDSTTCLGMWAWKINLKKSNHVLPPSRKVVQIGALKKGRKLLRISYNLHSSSNFLTGSGMMKLRCSTPIEPFVVWPSLKQDSMRKIFLQVLRPIGHRWSNILPTSQYDLSVSSTVFGPGDKFEWGFRIVPRGHTCSNLFFKLVERYELLDQQQLSNPTYTSGNPIFDRILINWDYRSDYNDDSKSPSDDLFNRNFREFTIPTSPLPNPTTTISELMLQEDGSPAPLNTIPSEGMPVPKYGCIRHQIRIKITFNGAPSIRLECPVVILSSPASKLREYYIITRPKSNYANNSVNSTTVPPTEPPVHDPKTEAGIKVKVKQSPESKNAIEESADNQCVAKASQTQPPDTSLNRNRVLVGSISNDIAQNKATEDPLKSLLIPYNGKSRDLNEDTGDKLLLATTAPPSTLDSGNINQISSTVPSESGIRRNRHTWDSPLSSSSSTSQLNMFSHSRSRFTATDITSEPKIQNIHRKADALPFSKNNATTTPSHKDRSDSLELISAQISILKLENSKIVQKIAELELKLSSIMNPRDNNPSVDIPSPCPTRSVDSKGTGNATYNILYSSSNPTILGWKLSANNNSSTENRSQAHPDDLFVESNPMPSSNATYPEPINVKCTRPKFIRAKSNDFIYPKISGSSIIKSALGVFTTSHSANSSSISRSAASTPNARIEDKRK